MRPLSLARSRRSLSGHAAATLFAIAQGRWIQSNLKRAAAITAPVQGLDADVVESALRAIRSAWRP